MGPDFGWRLGLAGALAGLAILHHSPLRYLYEQQDAANQPATTAWLSSAQLQTFDDDGGIVKSVRAPELWKDRGAVVMVVRRPGCILCRRQAVLLTKLKPEFEARGVKLFAVTHEKQGVEGFKTYFSGDVYLDKKRVFYGPQERWLSYLGLLKMAVMRNAYEAWRVGVDGTILEGEGRLLGAVYVIGPGEQGVIMEHRESVFGEIVKEESILKALSQLDATEKDNKKLDTKGEENKTVSPDDAA